MASKKKYPTYGFGRIINIILAIFPLTNIIFGVVKRALNENWLGVILNIILLPIFYIVDIVTIILYDDLRLLAK